MNDLLKELAAEMCKGRKLKCEHPISSVRGKIEEKTSIIYIWYDEDREAIKLQLCNNDDDEEVIIAFIEDVNGNCEWEERYNLYNLDPYKLQQDCFGEIRKHLQKKLGDAQEVVKATSEYLNEINKDVNCNCGSEKISYWVNDGYGIPLCKVCEDCEAEKLKGYRSDIMECYECDELIEAD